MHRNTRRMGGTVAVALVVLAVACARVRPLEGGAPDKTPPTVLHVLPADSSVMLPRLARFEIQWSEPLASDRARTGVRIEPPVRIADVRLNGTHMTIMLADSLPADTTVVVTLTKRIQDRGGRDNKLAGEIPFVYSTGPRLRGAAVLGKILVKGHVEPHATVRWEPVSADSTPHVRSRRGPVAVANEEGLFRLLGIPASQPFVLRAFYDRNEDLVAAEDELAVVYPETLRLEPGAVRRGLELNLIDPNEKGTLTGVAITTASIRGPLAIAVRRVLPAPGASPDSLGPDSTAARADTLRPRPGVVPPRDTLANAAAWARLEPRGFVRRDWIVVYASPRGDYSVHVAPGTQAIIAFVDVRRDSVPGLYVASDSTGLLWEPLVAGDNVFVGPGAKVRAKTLEIRDR